MPASEIALLVLESGGWLVGIDALAARDIRRADEGLFGHAPEVADLLGGRLDGLDPTSPRSFRALTVVDEAGECTVLFDRAVATPSVSRESLLKVPESLRRFGAPPWWLGTWWWQERLVLLVDLVAADAWRRA